MIGEDKFNIYSSDLIFGTEDLEDEILNNKKIEDTKDFKIPTPLEFLLLKSQIKDKEIILK
jgi:hypothetical protein